jgi:hypothetical protein
MLPRLDTVGPGTLLDQRDLRVPVVRIEVDQGTAESSSDGKNGSLNLLLIIHGELPSFELAMV